MVDYFTNINHLFHIGYFNKKTITDVNKFINEEVCKEFWGHPDNYRTQLDIEIFVDYLRRYFYHDMGVNYVRY